MTELTIVSGMASSTFNNGDYNINKLYGGVGLDSNRSHSHNFKDMWLAESGQINGQSLTFFLDRPARIKKIGIWPYNYDTDQDRSAKELTIVDEKSNKCGQIIVQRGQQSNNLVTEQLFFEGQNFTKLQGTSVRLEIISNWGASYVGLSHVALYGNYL